MQPTDGRPSYVRFERRPVEDRTSTIETGSYRTKDVDFAIITPIGSKDEIDMLATSWLADLEKQVREERIPSAWRDQYRAAYESWKRGEEIPLNGTPIKGWQVLSPSQQQNIISARVYTVEDLAQANGEAMSRIGMGAVELKQKAEKWLQTAGGTGKLVEENAALRAEMKTLQQQVANLTERLAAMVSAEEASA